MAVTLAFDVYGTLIDTHGVVSKLRAMVGDRADEFSRLWRDKQLEYSFRRGLMQYYENFAVCTKQALDYTCAFFDAPLTDKHKDELLGAYRVLPAFDDVKEGLASLNTGDFRAYAFSNGSAQAVETLLQTAGIRQHFLGVVSVDDVKSFKPNPAVYAHFLRQSSASGGSAWMVSSNPFDVIGALAAGMKAVWVRRSPTAFFDPWGIDPTLTVTGLRDLGERIWHFEQGTTA
jgi:2-haloacid dehalogenase